METFLVISLQDIACILLFIVQEHPLVDMWLLNTDRRYCLDIPQWWQQPAEHTDDSIYKRWEEILLHLHRLLDACFFR